jgi:glycosyltransferase involved in cell wall biosynthesis
MPSKRHDLAIAGAAKAGKKIKVIGEGPERAALEENVRAQKAEAEFLGPLTHEQLRNEYRKAAYLIHTSETGSLDKVVLEALANGLTVITTSSAFLDFPVTKVDATPEAIAAAIHDVRENPDRAAIIQKNHSLSDLIPKIMQSLQS